ncbi:hypothetical protein NBRC110019_29240 [Neptunitalea chrysea]|uniref:DUF3823 domain-containing protein n=1 Tax=Neptunitalea chrysea TaxID=1647581 RepID=A0A9W6B777_9FLAO|nr:DUF3823 domain-containing protein [Neptunitalea chrysea]GLB53883.1 hypothetical protein NBRC110019_29240 [Neptunitalea chrysea]
MKIKYVYIMALMMLTQVFVGCELDNYDEPDAMLSGSVVYEGETLGIRGQGATFALYQDGYELHTSIPVYIAQDGTYSANLFKGEYKLVRIDGAPWVSQSSDTLVINVNGSTEYDVAVTPYFTISDESFNVQSGTVNTSFKIKQVVSTSSLSEVNIYLRSKILLDDNYYDYKISVDVSDITLGDLKDVEVTIPDDLLDNEYLYIRVGAKSSSSSEFIYTQSQKIIL